MSQKVASVRRTKSFPSFGLEKYKNSRTLYILKLVINKLLYYIVCSISVIICNLDLLFCTIWNPGDTFLSGYFSFKIRSMSTTSGMDAMWLSPWKHLVQKRYWLPREWEKYFHSVFVWVFIHFYFLLPMFLEFLVKIIHLLFLFCVGFASPKILFSSNICIALDLNV